MVVKNVLPSAVLLLAMSFFIYDIAIDFTQIENEFWHVIIELLVCCAISTALYFELRRVHLLRKVIKIEQSKNARLAGELLSVMTAQFSQWQLTPSESEIALLLIKGLSMKEIAEARHVKEKTIRSQATKIYSKTNCAGRHELAAHFIEDLMQNL